jgi:hypothetical protein
VFRDDRSFGAVDIQSSGIGPGPESLVFMFDSRGSAGLCVQGLMVSEARLNARLFVRTENELIGPEFTAVPGALVEIQEPASLPFEVRGLVDFFGTPACTTRGIAWVLHTDAAVMPGYGYWDGDLRKHRLPS